MTNLTLTINLDKLTPTQLAALHVVVLAGVRDVEDRITAHTALVKAGEANCGDDYWQTYPEVKTFLNGKEA